MCRSNYRRTRACGGTGPDRAAPSGSASVPFFFGFMVAVRNCIPDDRLSRTLPPSLARRVGEGESGDRGGAGEGGGGSVTGGSNAAPRAGGTAAARIPRRLAGLHRARPGLRLGQLPVSRAARAQGRGAPGATGSRGDGVSAGLSGGRPGQRPGDRAQRLCGGAGPRLDMGRRDPVDAAQRVPGVARSNPQAPGHHRMPRRAAGAGGRGVGGRGVGGPGVGGPGVGMAGGRRGDRQSALSRRQAPQHPPRRRLRIALVQGLRRAGAGGGRSGLLLVREGGGAGEGGPGEAGRARLDQLHPGRGEPPGLAGGDPGAPDLRGVERRAVGDRRGGGARPRPPPSRPSPSPKGCRPTSPPPAMRVARTPPPSPGRRGGWSRCGTVG